MTKPMNRPALRAELVFLLPAAERYADHLLPKAFVAGVDTPLRMAHFLAQLAVESRRFERVRESLNYSYEGLLDTFGRHRISEETALRLCRNASRPADQAGIANVVYGGEWGRKNLGNTEPNDGARFIGHGLKQVTGRANHAACDKALKLGGRLLITPELLERADLAVDSAIWFWTSNNINRFADTDNVEAVTRLVNGGANGLTERQTWLTRLKAVIK